ncbi:dihydrodipicolinate synthase family protein [Agromyces sp. NPDC058484]|uniref:dihydrodipicolinate synthase family protein n=1 Tax=Agromyces sp. NPDC058484 TaxID=3346524 RepID=UPI00365ABAF2
MASAARGITPASLTAWDGNEQYDPAAQERYITWLLENGADSISVAGSTGEMLAMDNDEQIAIIDHVTRFVAGQVPVLASVGKYGTAETLKLAHAAKASGADQLMVILPYYYTPSKEAAIRHIRRIHDEVGLPICLYNNPNFAGYELSPRQAAELFDDGVVVSIKAAHGDPARVADLRALSEGITIFYGHDYSPLGGYAAGADGWLSGLPAAFPKQCRELQTAVRDEKDLDKGRELWKKFVPFMEYFMDPARAQDAHWLEIFKYAVKYQGIDTGSARSPLAELSDAQKAKVEPLIDTLVA